MWNNVESKINQALNAIRKPFRGVLSRVNSKSPVQTVQLQGLEGENLPDNELFQHYGYTSSPPIGAMGIMLPLGGKTSHGIIIATEHGQYRLTGLASGEVALYTDEGAKIVLKRGRIIEVDCDEYKVNCKTYEINASAKADINTPTLTASQALIINGPLTGNGGASVSGDAIITGKVMANEVSGGNISLTTHTHNDAENRPTTHPNS